MCSYRSCDFFETAEKWGPCRPFCDQSQQLHDKKLNLLFFKSSLHSMGPVFNELSLYILAVTSCSKTVLNKNNEKLVNSVCGMRA